MKKETKNEERKITPLACFSTLEKIFLLKQICFAMWLSAGIHMTSFTIKWQIKSSCKCLIQKLTCIICPKWCTLTPQKRDYINLCPVFTETKISILPLPSFNHQKWQDPAHPSGLVVTHHHWHYWHHCSICSVTTGILSEQLQNSNVRGHPFYCQ